MATRLSNRSDRQTRLRRIVQILRSANVESQAELARVLARRGDAVTQATLSRDLEELGAFKTRTPAGRVVYRVPEEPPETGGWLERMLREFALDVEGSGNLCVVRTPPGCAHPVARALDNADVSGVLGTIAGDDTILVIAREGVKGAALARKLRALAGQT